MLSKVYTQTNQPVSEALFSPGWNRLHSLLLLGGTGDRGQSLLHRPPPVTSLWNLCLFVCKVVYRVYEPDNYAASSRPHLTPP